MGRANRNFGDDPTFRGPGLENFNPGSNTSEDWGVVRQVDGHEPYETGMDGSNVHVPDSNVSPGWNDPIGVKVEDD